MFFRRLQGLFAVKMMCENGKMRCEDGENAVRKRRNCGAMTAVGGVVAAEIHCVTAVGGAFRAFPILISRILQSIPPFSPPFYSKSTHYINIFHLPKPPYRHSNMRKQC